MQRSEGLDVWKQETSRDLVPAIEAILGGAHFVSARVVKSDETACVD